MGLDLSIYMKVIRKRDKEEMFKTEIAYWRKAYGIRNELYYIARNEEYWVNPDEEQGQDYLTTFNSDGLRAMIETISDELSDFDSDCWTSSIWSKIETISITLEQLKTMCAALMYIETGYIDEDAIREFCPTITFPIFDMSEEEVNHILSDNDEKYETFRLFYKFYQNPEDYDFVFILENSY